MLGVLLHTLEAHEGMRTHGMSWGSRDGAYVDAVGLTRHTSHAIPPLPDQEAHAKYRVAKEALAINFLVEV